MKLDKSLKPLGVIAGFVLLLFVVGYLLQFIRPVDEFVMGQPGMMLSYGGDGAVAGKAMPSSVAPQPAMMDTFAERSLIAPIEPPFGGTGATPEERENIGERIIQTGSVYMRVDDAARRLEEIRGIVQASGGFVADASISDDENIKSAYLTARIPVERYDETRAKIRAIGSTIFNETSHAEDVTDQFVDLDARLRAAKAEEEQYLEILNRAATVEDTLKVTAQLGQVRARIEQMEGQLRFLRDRTEYATFSVQMTEEARVQIPTDQWRPGEVLREALRDLVLVGQSLINLAITAAIFILGLLVPLGLIIWLFVWVAKRVSAMFRRK